jgi:hypothetical protein
MRSGGEPQERFFLEVHPSRSREISPYHRWIQGAPGEFKLQRAHSLPGVRHQRAFSGILMLGWPQDIPVGRAISLDCDSGWLSG